MASFLILLAVIAVLTILDLYFGWTKNWFAGQARQIGRQFARRTYHSNPNEIEAYAEKAVVYFALLKERGFSNVKALSQTKKHYDHLYRRAREKTFLDMANENLKRANADAKK
jgi:hypothetical protein